jgi:hypothetical protein
MGVDLVRKQQVYYNIGLASYDLKFGHAIINVVLWYQET